MGTRHTVLSHLEPPRPSRPGAEPARGRGPGPTAAAGGEAPSHSVGTGGTATHAQGRATGRKAPAAASPRGEDLEHRGEQSPRAGKAQLQQAGRVPAQPASPRDDRLTLSRGRPATHKELGTTVFLLPSLPPAANMAAAAASRPARRGG